MAAGRLVPDELVIAMVQERIACSEPFPLDGFPRTLALTELLRSHDRSVTAAIFIDAPDHVVIDRIARRDDRRDDDTPERYASGSPSSVARPPPSIGCDERLGILRTVEGTGPIDAVYASTRELLLNPLELSAASLVDRA